MFDQLVCRVMFHQMRYEGIFRRHLNRVRWSSRVTWDVRMGRDLLDPNREAAIANQSTAVCFETDPAVLVTRWNTERCQRLRVRNRHQPQYGIPMASRSTVPLTRLVCRKQPAWGYISALDLENQ